MPTQMLAYLRLARLTDPALLAKVHQTFCTLVLPKSQPLFLSAPSVFPEAEVAAGNALWLWSKGLVAQRLTN